MNNNEGSGTPSYSRVVWFIAIGGLLTVLIALVLSSPRRSSQTDVAATAVKARRHAEGTPRQRAERVFGRRNTPEAVGKSADEIVALKLAQFGSKLRELVHALAERFKVRVP